MSAPPDAAKAPDPQLWRTLGLDPERLQHGALVVHSPIDGRLLGRLEPDAPAAIEARIAAAVAAFERWRAVPAPRRGELVRRLAERVRAREAELAQLISWEVGKIRSEAHGEVREVIDICDFAVGLSRQLHGLTIASERPRHHLLERWHPLGPVGIITAFNFPMAVWAWNAALALVCGDSLLWKPSDKAPLCALALHEQLLAAARECAEAPDGLSQLVVGAAAAGEQLVDDVRIPLISATGSTRMGRAVGTRVAARFGRSLLELGGNNALIVAPSADLELAVRAIVFSAAGTAGQRCTTLRRLIVHREVHDRLLCRLEAVWRELPVGSPLAANTLFGPLIDRDAFERMQGALAAARAAGGRVLGGERVLSNDLGSGYYVRPALVAMDRPAPICAEETFAPILYVFGYDDLAGAIALQNDVRQGLSSSLFTTDLREAELFLSAEGSNCGLANINLGTSGAEIGGAFGGEKDTGGGREAGSDAWRAYMRRQTQTINYSRDLPLAQGVRFDVAVTDRK